MSVDPHLVALLGMPKLGPRRLTALLAEYGGDAGRAWDAVAGGRVDARRVRMGRDEAGAAATAAVWRSVAEQTDIRRLVDEHARQGIRIVGPDDPAWPVAFHVDPEPPRALFVRGDLAVAEPVSVAIVGTRRCTAGGASVARELGHDLAAAGVGVVSGLALGIDGAAHQGSLAAGGPTVGVVATGLDVVYPRRHVALWESVATEGLLLSESPLGTKPERWRFPARNRLIAALAAAVVVVESPRRGGSMLTVESAIERQTDVLAVPGPVRAPTSDGPNQLIVEGCPLVRDATDVLVALGSAAPPLVPHQLPLALPTGGDPDPVADAVSWPPATLDGIVETTGLPFAEVAARLAQLEVAGVVQRVADGYQRAVTG